MEDDFLYAYGGVAGKEADASLYDIGRKKRTYHGIVNNCD
jgi:hypothetical protein